MPKIDLVEGLPWNFAVDSETGEVYQVSSGLTERGQEIPDPVPMSPPVGFVRNSESLVDMVRRFVKSEYLARQTDDAGMETFEEADDFSWDDKEDALTPYEEIFEPPVKRAPEVAGEGSAAAPIVSGPAPAPPEAAPAKPQGGDGGTIPPVAKP